MRSILLLAYQISPSKGSEYAVGWNFLINLAHRNKVYVLCGASGEHMGDTAEIEDYFRKHPHPNVFLIPVSPTRLIRIINWPNQKNLFSPIFYLAFALWHKKAYREALKLSSDYKIDIIHHLNPIGFREPGYLWKLNKPFIWGPVGGAAFVNPILLKNIPFAQKSFFQIKNVINSIQLRYGLRIRKAAKRSSTIIFSNSENKANFENFIGVTGEIISEQGTFERGENTSIENVEYGDILMLVWSGQISYRKNLTLLLNALALVKNRNKWKLTIIGDGESISNYKSLAQNLSISKNISWVGRVTRKDSIELMSKSNLHVMSSLCEGNPAVLYEAISLGIPTISLDRDGMHDVLVNGNGVLIPVTTYEETIKLYANNIDRLIEEPKFLKQLSERTYALSELLQWKNKINKFEKIYENAILGYKENL